MLIKILNQIFNSAILRLLLCEIIIMCVLKGNSYDIFIATHNILYSVFMVTTILFFMYRVCGGVWV